MRKRKKIIAIAAGLTATVAVMPRDVYASPSISAFHSMQNKDVVSLSSESTDETNTAALLSQTEIYTNQAISDQYKEKDENGELRPTEMSELIDTAASTITETNENGKSIVEAIPDVSEILSNISQQSPQEYEKEFGYDPDELDQLTYMMDFKYVSTDYRVIAGEELAIENRKEVLDNGMICASVNGNEILRSASKEDFVIIQVDPVTHKVYFFEMATYDEKTGMYSVDFPCIGPYMITQIRAEWG